MDGKLGGLVMRVDGRLVFLSAEVVREVAPLPPITRVPGAPQELLGIALHKDDLVPVIAIGSAREAMVICTHLGEHVGLVGGSVVGTGVFEASASAGVTLAGERAEEFDLGSVYARVEAGRWLGRWGG
jgi:hypothetical protein